MSRFIRSAREFEALRESGKKFLVLFYATWCPYCLRFLPVFETHCGRGADGCYRIDVDELEGLEDRYGVEVVPAVLCFESRGVAARLDGVPGRGLSERQLTDFIASQGMGKGVP